MTASITPLAGTFALVLAAGAAVVVTILCCSVKIRSATGRWLGVRVYDFGADLKLPPTLHSRSYQIAHYLTMKSLPREPVDPPSP